LLDFYFPPPAKKNSAEKQETAQALKLPRRRKMLSSGILRLSKIQTGLPQRKTTAETPGEGLKPLSSPFNQKREDKGLNKPQPNGEYRVRTGDTG
jgi:hypothetical protein